MQHLAIVDSILSRKTAGGQNAVYTQRFRRHKCCPRPKLINLREICMSLASVVVCFNLPLL